MVFIKNLFRKTVKIKYSDNLIPDLIQEKNKRIDLRVFDIYTYIEENAKDEHGGFHKRPSKDKVKIDWRRDEEGKEYIELCHRKKIFFDLGIVVEMPEGYEAEITPRSGLYGNHGLILTNSVGVIDNDYKGEKDVWGAVCKKEFFSRIYRYERLFQCKIVKNMELFNLVEVKKMSSKSRGGYGSTGKM